MANRREASAVATPAAPETTAAVPFCRSPGTGQHLLQVVHGHCAYTAQQQAEVLLGYVRDRLEAAVQGTAADDGSDTSITGDEAFVLGFVMQAAVAIVQSLPTERLPAAAVQEGAP